MGCRRVHGLSAMVEYRAWQTMRQRCTVRTHPRFATYGGRGITLCAGWLLSPEAFVADMGPKPTLRHELDRKNNDQGYWCGKCEECARLGRPPNCRWVTRSQNDRNRRSNLHLTLGRKTYVLVE